MSQLLATDIDADTRRLRKLRREHLPVRLFDTLMQTFTTEPQANYAILSHRWNNNELTFTELSTVHRRIPSAQQHPTPTTVPLISTSNAKFNAFCQIAHSYGCRYVWMDSSCINQQNAKELDASIRSMFWWYANAAVCIVYLSDITPRGEVSTSEWFKRGWTLQEFLAPQRMAFFDREWGRIAPFRYDVLRGSRANNPQVDEYNLGVEGQWLRERLAKAAGIDQISLLYSTYKPSSKDYELVMNWAKTRQTTREEDGAYSLISLLNVCLPPSYGEGRVGAMSRLEKACSHSGPQLQSARKFEICAVSRDLTKLCQHHREQGGRPLLIRITGRGLSNECDECLSFTPSEFHDGCLPTQFLLFTSTPLPDSKKYLLRNLLVRDDLANPEYEKTGSIQQVPLLLMDMGKHRHEIVPSVFQWCQECCGRMIT
ncbi:hypothetical protein ONZ45_g8138 [Pleurotus djamor]|nr:hypothetical protein ONZ45_g8138 [Pleurotus djamor]